MNLVACEQPVSVIVNDAGDFIANFQWEITEDGYPVYELKDYAPSLRSRGLYVLRDGTFTPLTAYQPEQTEVDAFDAWLERGETICH